ncbi:uncharacterized protein LOC120653383 [Panicum virgatum]|uniref:uncharacterized protein LOC120653383 n=1 Tax=Panicum virgatum TaxID=38727 RepID=UPI0019D64B60|nr:uncharacterized protein LOC120653383 [Panicum virgatum]
MPATSQTSSLMLSEGATTSVHGASHQGASHQGASHQNQALPMSPLAACSVDSHASNASSVRPALPASDAPQTPQSVKSTANYKDKSENPVVKLSKSALVPQKTSTRKRSRPTSKGNVAKKLMIDDEAEEDDGGSSGGAASADQQSLPLYSRHPLLSRAQLPPPLSSSRAPPPAGSPYSRRFHRPCLSPARRTPRRLRAAWPALGRRPRQARRAAGPCAAAGRRPCARSAWPLDRGGLAARKLSRRQHGLFFPEQGKILTLPVLRANSGGLVVKFNSLQGFVPNPLLSPVHWCRDPKRPIQDVSKDLVGTSISVKVRFLVRAGRQVQEVYLTSSLDQEGIKKAVQRVLGRVP